MDKERGMQAHVKNYLNFVENKESMSKKDEQDLYQKLKQIQMLKQYNTIESYKNIIIEDLTNESKDQSLEGFTNQIQIKQNKRLSDQKVPLQPLQLLDPIDQDSYHQIEMDQNNHQDQQQYGGENLSSTISPEQLNEFHKDLDQLKGIRSNDNQMNKIQPEPIYSSDEQVNIAQSLLFNDQQFHKNEKGINKTSPQNEQNIMKFQENNIYQNQVTNQPNQDDLAISQKRSQSSLSSNISRPVESIKMDSQEFSKEVSLTNLNLNNHDLLLDQIGLNDDSIKRQCTPVSHPKILKDTKPNSNQISFDQFANLQSRKIDDESRTEWSKGSVTRTGSKHKSVSNDRNSHGNKQQDSRYKYIKKSGSGDEQMKLNEQDQIENIIQKHINKNSQHDQAPKKVPQRKFIHKHSKEEENNNSIEQLVYDIYPQLLQSVSNSNKQDQFDPSNMKKETFGKISPDKGLIKELSQKLKFLDSCKLIKNFAYQQQTDQSMMSAGSNKLMSSHYLRPAISNQSNQFQPEIVQDNNTISINSMDNSTRLCQQSKIQQPLFELQIQIPDQQKKELIKFYDNQDPYALAMSLHLKYPNIIDKDNGVVIVEQKIRERLIEALAIRQQREISILQNMKETIHNDYQNTDPDLDVDQNEEITNENPNANIQIPNKRQPQNANFQPGLSNMQTIQSQKNEQQKTYSFRENQNSNENRYNNHINNQQIGSYMKLVQQHESIDQSIEVEEPVVEQEEPIVEYENQPLEQSPVNLEFQSNPQQTSINYEYNQAHQVIDKQSINYQFASIQPQNINTIDYQRSTLDKNDMQTKDFSPFNKKFNIQSRSITRFGSPQRRQSQQGTRLYLQAKELQDKKQRLKNYYQQQDQEKEIQELEQQGLKSFFQPKMFTNRSKQYQRQPNVKLEDDMMNKYNVSKQKIRKMKQDQELDILKQANNFQPKINLNSKIIDSQKVSHCVHKHYKSVDLIQHVQKARKNCQAQKSSIVNSGEENIQSDDDEEFPDQPQLNDDCKFIKNNQKQQTNNRFFELYENAIQTKAKIEKLRQDFRKNEATFKPVIFTKRYSSKSKCSQQEMNESKFIYANKSSFSKQRQSINLSSNNQEQMQSSGQILNVDLNNPVAKLNVWSRMREDQQRHHQKSQRSTIEQNDNLVDQRTGQVLFKPKIVSEPLSSRVRDDINPKQLSDYLYQHGQILQRKKQLKAELIYKKEQADIAQNAYKTAGNKSQSIVEKKLRQRLQEIFCFLDGNKDGYISSEFIDLDFIEPQILIIFKPLLVEMENYNEQLTEQEFVESSIIMLQSCTINERNFILNYGQKKRSSAPKYSFKPQVNNKSTILASKVFKKIAAVTEEPHNRFEKQKQISKNYKKTLENQQIEREKQICTFKPKIKRLKYNKNTQMNSINDYRLPLKSSRSVLQDYPSYLRDSNQYASPYKSHREGISTHRQIHSLSPNELQNDNQYTDLHNLDKISEIETNKEQQRDSNIMRNDMQSKSSERSLYDEFEDRIQNQQSPTNNTINSQNQLLNQSTIQNNQNELYGSIQVKNEMKSNELKMRKQLTPILRSNSRQGINNTARNLVSSQLNQSDRNKTGSFGGQRFQINQDNQKMNSRYQEMRAASSRLISNNSKQRRTNNPSSENQIKTNKQSSDTVKNQIQSVNKMNQQKQKSYSNYKRALRKDRKRRSMPAGQQNRDLVNMSSKTPVEDSSSICITIPENNRNQNNSKILGSFDESKEEQMIKDKHTVNSSVSNNSEVIITQKQSQCSLKTNIINSRSLENIHRKFRVAPSHRNQDTNTINMSFQEVIKENQYDNLIDIDSDQIKQTDLQDSNQVESSLVNSQQSGAQSQQPQILINQQILKSEYPIKICMDSSSKHSDKSIQYSNSKQY